MGLRTVAEEDDIAHHHSQGLNAETEVTPAIVAPEEQDGDDCQYPKLDDTEIGQQPRLQSRGKEQTRVIDSVAMDVDDVEHVLIEQEHVVEGGVDKGQQEQHSTPEEGIAEIPPELGIAQEESQFDGTVDLRGSGDHDEQHGPEGFATFQQDEGKEENIAHHHVVLETESALQYQQQEEEEYLHPVGSQRRGQRLDGQ